MMDSLRGSRSGALPETLPLTQISWTDRGACIKRVLNLQTQCWDVTSFFLHLKSSKTTSSLRRWFVSSCGEKVRISGRLKKHCESEPKGGFHPKTFTFCSAHVPTFYSAETAFLTSTLSIYGETVRRYWILGLKMWRFERKWDGGRRTFYGNVWRNKWIWSVFGLKKAGLEWFYKLKEAVHLSKKKWVKSRTKLGLNQD